MKHLILAAIFFASQLAWGANEPVFTKGFNEVDEPGKQLRQLKVPHFQVTDLGKNAFLLDTGNKNSFPNPEMEATTGLPARPVGWTASTGMIGFSTSSNANWGKSLSWTPNASGYVSGPQSELSNDCYQMNCQISFMWKSDGTEYTLQLLNSSNVVQHSFALPDTDNKLIPVSFNFVPTVSLMNIRIAASGSASSMFADSFYLGAAKNIGSVNNRIFARATRSSNQTGINPNNSSVKINFNSDVYDPHDMFNTSNGRMEVKFQGTCTFNASVSISTTNVLNTYYNVRIFKNGSDNFLTSPYQIMSSGTSFRIGLTSVSTRVQPGDYFETYLYGSGNNSSSTIEMFGSDFNSWFAIDCVSDAQLALGLNTLPSQTNPKCETPSWINVGFSTFSNNSICWYKDGAFMVIDGFMFPSGGTGSASVFQMNIPGGFQIDNSANRFPGGSQSRYVFGWYNFYNDSGGAAGDSGHVHYSTNSIVGFRRTNSASFTTSAMTTSDAFSFNFKVPIVGWNAPAVEMPLVTHSVVTKSSNTTTTGTVQGACTAASSFSFNGNGMAASVTNAVDGGAFRTCTVTFAANYFVSGSQIACTAGGLALTSGSVNVSSLTGTNFSVTGPDSDFSYAVTCTQVN